ncbi:MAG: hypothetical protein SPL96_06240 [Bacteroidales bacterium]|nr:hypothetical protein [Bacteroidales bacterium]
MKKLVIAIGTLFVVSAWSCTDNVQTDNQEDTTDSVEVVTETADSLTEVTGVAIDGAMNSVYLKVGEDTIEFSYPDLDADRRATWEINDTLTVRYYATESGDSVTQVINHADA